MPRGLDAYLAQDTAPPAAPVAVAVQAAAAVETEEPDAAQRAAATPPREAAEATPSAALPAETEARAATDAVGAVGDSSPAQTAAEAAPKLVRVRAPGLPPAPPFEDASQIANRSATA